VLVRITSDIHVSKQLWRVREQCSLLQISDAVMTKEEQSKALDDFAAVLNGMPDVPMHQPAMSGLDETPDYGDTFENADEDSRPRKKTRKTKPAQFATTTDEESDILFELAYLQGQDIDMEMLFSPSKQGRRPAQSSNYQLRSTVSPQHSSMSQAHSIKRTLSSDEVEL
jgi:hypothetical protein